MDSPSPPVPWVRMMDMLLSLSTGDPLPPFPPLTGEYASFPSARLSSMSTTLRDSSCSASLCALRSSLAALLAALRARFASSLATSADDASIARAALRLASSAAR